MTSKHAAIASILIVVTSGELGGAERMVLDLLAGMPSGRYRFRVLLPRLGRLATQLDRLQVSYDLLPFGRRLSTTGKSARWWSMLVTAFDVVKYLWLYLRLLRQYKPNLIYTHGLKAEILSGIATYLAKIPVVWHLHSFVPQAGWLCRLHRHLQRRTRLIIANSQAVARSSGHPVQATRVVYCGVDPMAFAPIPTQDARRSLGLSTAPGLFTVGMVSVLAPWKGIEVFLRAVEPLLRSDHRWQAVVVGEPLYDTSGHQGYDRTLRQLVEVLAIGDRVTFLPYQLHPGAAFSSLDIFVHAARAPEPFGRVIAEAMCAQRAVIATAGGGAAEQIESGVDGLLVAMNDQAALQSAVATLMADPDLRERLGQAARSKILRYGTMDRFIERLSAVLAEAVATPGAKAEAAAPDHPRQAA